MQTDTSEKEGIRHLLSQTNILLVISNYGAVAFIGMAITALIPLVMMTSHYTK